MGYVDIQGKISKMDAEFVYLDTHEDQRGTLTVCESGIDIPFVVKRAFWITNVPIGETRGDHAHKECHQFLVAIRGNVFIKINSRDRMLFGSNKGWYIPPGNTVEMTHFPPGAILLVLCSHEYDAEDYIYDN